jgi:hypothetical protein
MHIKILDSYMVKKNEVPSHNILPNNTLFDAHNVKINI